MESRAVPWIVLAISLAVTLAVWLSARLELKRQDAARYERLKERVLAAIEGRFQSAQRAIHGGRALVHAETGEVSNSQWTRYVESVWPFFDRGVISLGYARRVAADQIEAVENRIRANGRLNFTAERASGQPDVFLITQLEPLTQNAAALGTDLGKVPDARAAAEYAMRMGGATITRPMPVLENGRRIPGCLLFLPVYTKSNLTEPAERTRAIQGWVYASLRINSLLEEVAAAVEAQLEFEAFDGEVGGAETLLFDSDGNMDFDDANWSRLQGAVSATFTESLVRPVHGRTWLLRLRTTRAFDAQGNRTLPWYLLGGGVLLSFFGAGFTWTLVHSRGRALRLAEDMTANLRRAEAEARRLALVASRTASVVLLMDAEWRIEWVNESFERFFGFRFDEVKGRRPGDILHGPETDDAEMARINAAAEQGEPYKGEMLNYTKSGQPRWVEVDIQPLKDAGGKITGYMGLQLDITERKRIQAEIARKEAEFRFMFESAPLGLSWLWVGADGSRRRLTNQAHLKIIGLTAEQMRDSGIFRRITHPDDWEKQQEMYVKLERGEIDHFSVRKRYLRLDGQQITAELTFHRFRDATGYQEVSTLVDVTPLVRAQEEVAAKEAQFRFIFEATPIGILWRRVSGDGTVVRLINDAHLKLCGLTREEATRPQAFARVSDPAEYAAQ